MEILDYPCTPPTGIMHFPQGVFCLIKKKDTGKESVKITRVSGDEFEFEITPKNLTETEQRNFPIKICEYKKGLSEEEMESLSEKELDEYIKQEPQIIIKTEKKIDIVLNSKHRQILKDGEILKIGNTITYDAGTNLITLDDSVGAGDSWATAYDMEDALTNCAAVVTKQGSNAYDISARMLFLPGVYFVSESEFVELKPNPINPSYVIAANAGSHIRIGNYNSTHDYCYNGAFWRFYLAGCVGSQLDRFDGELLIYDSNWWSNSSHYNDAWMFWGTTRIYDTKMEGTAYLSGSDINLQRVVWQGKGGAYDVLLASGYDFEWTDVRVMNSAKGLFMSAQTTADIDIYDIVLTNNTQDYYESGNFLMRFINSSFDRSKIYVPTARKGLQECYTFNIKVTDELRVPLVGATVSLKDVDGVDAFTPEPTVVGGVLADDKIIKIWWKGYDNAAGTKDYNPHTLKVVDGANETEYEITIDHRISEDVVLMPATTATYDDIMTGIDDIKGTGFVKDTDSLPQCLTATGFSTHSAADVQITMEAAGSKLTDVHDASYKGSELTKVSDTEYTEKILAASGTKEFTITKAGDLETRTPV